MSHSHHHHHHNHRGSDLRLIGSIALNLLITLAEVVGGLLSGSLALLSDALHNFSDTSSLFIAYATRRLSKRAPTSKRTFGYRRAEILGAFVNLITLVLVALFLVKEAVSRFLSPQPIDGGIMMTVAIIGLAANVFTALLLWRDAQDSLNLRSAFLHIVTDAVSSVGVVLGGLLIMWYEIHWLDPVLTLLIAGYIVYQSIHMLKETIDILMDSTPPNLDLEVIRQDISGLPDVSDMHHVHVWQLDEQHTALEAHIVIAKQDLGEMEGIKARIKAQLKQEYAIFHATLEFEVDPCSQDTAHPCFESKTTPKLTPHL